MRKVVIFVIVLLFSTVAFAQSGGMNPVVAPDGTIFVMRPGTAGTTQLAPALMAFSPNGSALWKWEGRVRMHALAFDATQVFLVSSNEITPAHGGGMNGGMMGGGRETPRAGSAAIVSLSLANGTERWRRELDGAASGIEISGDRLYVVLHSAPTSLQRGRPAVGTASLVALDTATGMVVWTAALQ